MFLYAPSLCNLLLPYKVLWIASSASQTLCFLSFYWGNHLYFKYFFFFPYWYSTGSLFDILLLIGPHSRPHAWSWALVYCEWRKNKINKIDKNPTANGTIPFDLVDSFVRGLSDFGKALVGNSYDQALADMARNNLFVEVNKMLLEENLTPAMSPSKFLLACSNTQAWNVPPSISLFLSYFNLLKEKDLKSFAIGKGLMDILMDKFT